MSCATATTFGPTLEPSDLNSDLYAMSEHDEAMVECLARAMALMATTQKRWWPNRKGEMLLQEKSICPSLLQLLVIESRNNPDPKEREALEVKCTQDHIWATRAAAVCTEACRLAKQMTRQSNFDLTDVASTAMYTRYVGRRSQFDSMYTCEFGDETSDSADSTEYRAGNIRLRIERMCMDEIRAWLLKMARAIKFCIEQERGRNEDEAPLEIDMQLIRELTFRLARRAVVPQPSASPASSAPLRSSVQSTDPPPLSRLPTDKEDYLSAAVFRTMVDKYAKVSPELASTALMQTQESLQWLIQLCQSAPHSPDFRLCLSDANDIHNSGSTAMRFYNTRNGLEALRRITRQTDTPSELRTELAREGPMSAADDALTSLALALEQTSSLRYLQVAAWHSNYAKLVGYAARKALEGVNRSPTVSKAPFMHMVKTRRGRSPSSGASSAAQLAPPSNHSTTSTLAVDMPLPRHVRLKQPYTLTGPQLLLATERLGLTPTQILSNCIINVVWELIGRYEEFPPLTVAAPLAQAAFQVARHEAVLVIDTIAHEIVTSGTMVTKFLHEMRNDMNRNDGEFTDVVSATSYALRTFSCNDITHFLTKQTPENMLRVAGMLMSRLNDLLGERPMRNAHLPSKLMAECGLIVPEAVREDQQARLDVGFSSEIYYPRLAFDLLSYLIPSVITLRTRTRQRKLMQMMPTRGLDARTRLTLHCGMVTLPKARDWFVQTTDQANLRLTSKDLHALPDDVRRILDTLIFSRRIFWKYRTGNERPPTLELSRALFGLD